MVSNNSKTDESSLFLEESFGGNNDADEASLSGGHGGGDVSTGGANDRNNYNGNTEPTPNSDLETATYTESAPDSDPLETATPSLSDNEKQPSEYYTCQFTGKRKKRGRITGVPQLSTECEKRSNLGKGHDNVLEVLDVWTPAQLKNTLASEPRRARVYRTIAIWAGLVHPLDEKNFERGLKRYQGDEQEFDAKYMLSRTEKHGTGYQLHSSHLPFDAYTLMKEANMGFLFFLVALYFIGLSSIFVFFGWSVDCFNRDVTPGNFVAVGFLLLSGVGGELVNEPTVCLWVNAFAILIGVYMSIPILGAVVLVRLLDNRSNIIESTDCVLLTVRNGVPEIALRAVSGTGRSLSNFSAGLEASILVHDATHDDRYLTSVTLETKYSSFLAYHPNPIKHICDENSPLIQRGVVTVDEYGVPSWDKKKILGLFLSCDANGSRTHIKKFGYSPISFIEPDEKGRNPFFVNSTPVTSFHWRKFRGSVTPVGDLSKHSEWKYNEREFRPSSDKKSE